MLGMFLADMNKSFALEHKVRRTENNARRVGRSLKVRSSCDACSNAKVRCDRERPTCQRCTNAGMQCKYSISNRMGRPAGSARAGGANTGPIPPNSLSSTQRPSRVVTPELESFETLFDDISAAKNGPVQPSDTDLSGFNLGLDPASSVPWHDWNVMLDSCAESNSHTFKCPFPTPALPSLNDHMDYFDTWTPANQSSDAVQIQPTVSLDQLGGSRMDLPSFFSNIQGLQAASNCQELSSTPSDSRTGSNNVPGHTCNGSTSCTILASTTLNSLYLPSDFCTASTITSTDPAPLSTIDEILTTNSLATSTLNTVLQCPCSSNSSLTLTLGLIVLKILSCYTATARYPSPSLTPLSPPLTSTSSSSSITHLAISGAGMGQDMFLDVPVAMGAYQFDAEDERHLKLQLVLSELRKVSKTVDAFAGRYCAAIAAGEPAVDEAFYHALVKFLRKEWKSAVKEVVTVLRRHDDEILDRGE